MAEKSNFKEYIMITEKQSRLLVCSSENDRRREMTNLLERIGFAVVDEARDAREAERLMNDRMYSLVICETSIGTVEAMQLAYNESRKAAEGGADEIKHPETMKGHSDSAPQTAFEIFFDRQQQIGDDKSEYH